MSAEHETADQFARPASVTTISPITSARSAANTGSVCPTRDGSDQAALDMQSPSVLHMPEPPMEQLPAAGAPSHCDASARWWSGTRPTARSGGTTARSARPTARSPALPASEDPCGSPVPPHESARRARQDAIRGEWARIRRACAFHGEAQARKRR